MTTGPGRYRAVVVGCGNIGSRYDHHRTDGRPPLSHAGAYSAHPDYKLVGVVDPDATRLAECQQRWGVPYAVADFSELLTAVRLDIISIATPPNVRLAIVEQAIEHGVKAILCEKPLACTVAEGNSIVALCEAAGVILAVNYIRRWDAGCRAVRDLLHSGELGRIRRFAGAYVRGLHNNGGHLIDLVHWWHGEIAAVESIRRRETGSPDVTFVCTDGTPVDLLGLAGDTYDIFELDVFGQTGRVSLRNFGYLVSVQRAKPSDTIPQLNVLDEPRYLASNLDTTLICALDDISRCLQTAGVPACTGADGLAVLRALDLTAKGASVLKQ